MASAANRAAKTLGGSSRNRPSRQMSISNGLRSSLNAGGDSSGEGSGSGSGSGSTPAGTHARNNGTRPTHFMEDVRSQYESLSEKLAKENESTGLSGWTKGSSSIGYNNPSKSKSRKVRWAETAAIASTMDATNANNSPDDDPDYVQRSPVDILSDLFQKKYTLPVFLLLTTVIFLMLHLAGGPNDESFQRLESEGKVGRGRSNRHQNVGGGDGFGHIIFSLTPTDHDKSSMVPTIQVIHHITPKISPSSAGTPTVDGNEPGWIDVPIQSLNVFGLRGIR